MRRPEYAAATGANVGHGRRRLRRRLRGEGAHRRAASARAVEAAGSFIVHYPSYIGFVALANRLDLFLHAYLLVNAAHAGRRCWPSPFSWDGGAHESHHRRRGPRPAAGARDRRDPEVHGLVGGRAILHWQLDALAAAGVDDFVIVRGYLGDRIAAPAGPGPTLRFIENPEWASNNILASLLFAEAEMRDGFLFSYSDIVFAPEHAKSRGRRHGAGRR